MDYILIKNNTTLDGHLSYLIGVFCLSYFLMILEKKSDKIIVNVYCITGHKIMVQEF